MVITGRKQNLHSFSESQQPRFCTKNLLVIVLGYRYRSVVVSHSFSHPQSHDGDSSNTHIDCKKCVWVKDFVKILY